jgi:hypothetical protein
MLRLHAAVKGMVISLESTPENAS